MMILLVDEGANAASALIYFESSLHLLDDFKHQSRRNLRSLLHSVTRPDPTCCSLQTPNAPHAP
ncbi:hypothetical protein HanXRQr2_Chr12g0551201 [Helianthus annuus]|uniref:Uncharacterized protein n=1 Tax=Helianthus annuus TaxID=4232 RepID=A0A9K3HI47_HELAN|nr:hypothetical protein HanXRQr2_Chr12g0551201 [Helianthus annuus]KAJ0863496.1 hypothetical protein HanPSC8_Chr12g0530681 [Helianthus annuus]